jgi:general secretion pathway protein I
MNKQRGFSLLEILIAFSILALSLGILLKIFSSGINTAGVAEEYSAAVQIAESLMAQTGVETPLQPSESSGKRYDKYNWRVIISPFQFTAENLDVTTLPVELFKVKVTVNWSDDNSGNQGRELELITLKLANKTL